MNLLYLYGAVYCVKAKFSAANITLPNKRLSGKCRKFWLGGAITDSTKQRYSLLDALRAVAVINMIVYHLCYDIFCVFGVWSGFLTDPIACIWERLICTSFIIISGISLNFSAHGYKRGVLVGLCGMLVTAVTALLMPQEAIYFGVLTFLGCAMIFTFALRKPLSRINPVVGAVISLILFALFYGLPNGYIGFFDLPVLYLPRGLYSVWVLSFFGFPPANFISSDYFPFLQWIFLYIFGFMLWRIIKSYGLDVHFCRKIPMLDFIGRHSLLIYLLHQPILYGVTYAVFAAVGKV